jgi:hypothetical protein
MGDRFERMDKARNRAVETGGAMRHSMAEHFVSSRKVLWYGMNASP